MNLSLMFHKAYATRYGNCLNTFEELFDHISSKEHCTMPGDKLRRRMSYTLTFDDATYDFYVFIYPLLKKYNLKALLAVPVQFVPKSTSSSKDSRILDVKRHLDITKLKSSAFCTWDELIEMKTSGHIEIASHSMTHRNLVHNDQNLDYELRESKDRLEDKFQSPVTSFVAPYGQINKPILRKAKRLYPYVFRIGSAVNFSWNQNLLYRVSCDQLKKPLNLFKLTSQLVFLTKNLVNTVRGF